jgi:acyl carrier protein
MNDDEVLTLLRGALDAVAPGRAVRLDEATLAAPISALGLESVTVMELVGVLEERSGVLFPDEELARVRSVGDLGTLLRGQALG